MAYITPNSDVYLLKDIKITPTYSDTIYFASKAAQTTYFTNPAKRVATLTAQSYQRHSRGWLKVALPSGTVAQANYMMFKNTSFENKWFYAFITDWEYVNNNTTLISYMIDDVQTWFYDCTLGDCFVEREHALNDDVGSNRIPEPIGSDRTLMTLKWECADMVGYDVVIQASQENRSGSSWETDNLHQGLYNGLAVSRKPCNELLEADDITNLLNDMVGDGSYSDTATNQQQVVSVIMFPSKFTNTGGSKTVGSITVDNTPYTDDDQFSGYRTSLYGYVPRNKKLLTAPFKQILLTNGIGASINLDYDDFKIGNATMNPRFRVSGTLNGGGQIMCVPVHYKGVENNYDYKIVISEFPQCGYTLDSYRAWLAGGGDVKQKVGILQGIGNGLFGTLGLLHGASSAYDKLWNKNYEMRYEQSTKGKNLNQGALNAVNTAAGVYAGRNTSYADAFEQSGGVQASAGIIGGLVDTAISGMEKTYDAKVQPNVPVGMTAGNVMVGLRELNFRCYDVDINPTDAQIIDEFFDKYGYQTNRLKVPNISGRKAWNYIKTRECELVGNIPALTKASIIDIFNSGITFWKNGDNIGDYSQDNTLT